MSDPFLKRRRPAWRYFLTAAAAIVVLVAAGLVIETALSPRQPENPRPPTAPPFGSPGPVSGGRQAGSLGPLQVIRGSRLTGGVYTGFPHSEAGAVSAAAEDWSQIGSTLSPDRASQVGRLVTDPSWSDGPATMARGAAATRQGLGLPAVGPVPAGASVTLTPMAYQVRQASPDQVTVLLLGYYSISLPQQQPQTRVGVYPATMRWSGGDWKVMAPDPGTDYSGLLAQPGSAQAVTNGWQPLRR